jgi:isoamylase
MKYRLEHRTKRKLSAGSFYPQGATLTPDGVNFAIYSQHAREVFLLLFDRSDRPPTDIVKLENCSRRIWHVFVHGCKSGQLYAYKVRGDYNPPAGLRFNENKLLVDPYAKALTGKFRNQKNLLLGYDPYARQPDLTMDTRDNTEIVPKCMVIDDAFDWQGDVPPDRPLEKVFIYEVHVKGFTAHSSSKARYPGTYLGFIEKIPHLQELGINAVELLPVHEFYQEDFLVERGLTNYWGYNSIGFFSPEWSYSTQKEPGCQVREFKTMLRELHKAGIEVILDVVYNHTAEGSELGPTVCFRGIDNPTYYVLTGDHNEDRRRYVNYTGCGNSLNISDPQTIRLVMDSLRYWVEVMHVDGFRFDLASVLGRDEASFHRSASFFDAVSQDPVLSRIKLIAEPWDLATYQVGNFPIDWSEWNGRFRDVCRKFGKGDGGQLRELAWRITGSSDLYGDDGRSAFNSINFITCHDGFTLNDLVSYNNKHNKANKENNRDGTDDNNSWNCGAEGEVEDPEIIALRHKLIKNQVCYLLFSLGTPMILGGDEFLRTQKGNNNAYCQDNEISWFDWSLVDRNRDIYTFFCKAIAFIKYCTILYRRKFNLVQGEEVSDVPHLAWLGPDGKRPLWDDPNARTLCCLLDGRDEPSTLGDYRLFFILNADYNFSHVKLPVLPKGLKWYRVIDTNLPPGEDFCDFGSEIFIKPADYYHATPRSTIVLIGK